ncbi:ras-like GTP-binding protein RHO [Oculina patagonica]
MATSFPLNRCERITSSFTIARTTFTQLQLVALYPLYSACEVKYCWRLLVREFIMSAIRKKLVIVGDADHIEGRGANEKTHLLYVFVKGEAPKVYVPTVFEDSVADIEVDGQAVELALWDTAGQEDNARLRPLSYPATDVILMCFSIDRPESLESVANKWFPEVSRYCPNVPIILVGMKKDLRDDQETKEELSKLGRAPVTSEEGRAMCERINGYSYMECSAKKNDGVKEVFETAARAALLPRRRYGSSKCRIQ